MAKQSNLFHLSLLLHSFYYATTSPIQGNEINDEITAEYQEINSTTDLVTLYHNTAEAPIQSQTLPPVSLHTGNDQRVKRALDPNQGSSWLKFVWRERKYKIPQMFLTNIRNLWAVDPAGGRHLFDAGVPYGTVYLIKTLLLDSIFPRIGKNQ